MAGLTPSQIDETRRLLDEHGGNVSAVARALGLTRSTIQNRVQRVLAASSAANSNEKPRIRVPYLRAIDNIGEIANKNHRSTSEINSLERSTGKRTSILHWCDNHHKPGADLENVRLIARHARANLHRFDMIRHGGDMCDYDSVSQHDPLGSIQVKHKPSLAQDIEAHEECMAVFNQELGPHEIEKVADIGNHEWRVFKYEQLRGELEGSLWLQVKQLYARYGWRSNDFGVLDKVDGVTFTHIPLSANGGRPYGSPQTIVRDLTSDLVACHTHKGGHWPAPKIGGDVTYYNGACSLPHGVVKDYCKLNPTGWKWGVNEIIITDGKITDFSFISMLELQRRYG